MDEIEKIKEFEKEHLGIDVSAVEDKMFYEALKRYKEVVFECNKKYGCDRPPRGSEDYQVYVDAKKNVAKYFVRCKDENFKKIFLEQHPEFEKL